MGSKREDRIFAAVNSRFNQPPTRKQKIMPSIEPEFWFQTYANIVTLTSYMADNNMDAQEIADAVEKPWKFTEIFEEAQAELDND